MMPSQPSQPSQNIEERHEEETIQEITLQVPADYVLHSVFQTIDPKTTASILTLGAQTYTFMKKEGQKLRHETVFQQLQSQAAAEYEPRIQELQKQTQSTTEVITGLKRRLQEEETHRIHTEQRVRDEERRNREDLLKEKDYRIQSLEQQVKTQLQTVEQSMKENSRNLQESFQSFRESIVKTTSGSKKKGEHGETILQDMLQKAFGSVSCGEFFNIESVGKEGHQGDLRMNWKGHKILIEVKNYERSVDDKEVKKFLRDMEEGRDISLGILVSLNSGIVGHSKTGYTDIMELRDGRICIYLSHFLTHIDPVEFLQGLKPFIETFLLYKDKTNTKGEEATAAEYQVEKFEIQRTILLKLLQSHQESIRKFKNTIQNAKKKQEQIWLEIGTDMREAEHQVKLILETLLDLNSCVDEKEEDEIQSVNNELPHLPSYVFRNTDFMYYTEKERIFLKNLLTQFDIGEEYTCTKKELKDVLKPLGYSEETVNKQCERFFLEHVWGKGKQKLQYFKKRSA
jgi:hypothetical protein